jgi:hypothetical protein
VSRMGWVPVVLLGFTALNALVIALARDVTSRWERDADAAAPDVLPVLRRRRSLP